MEIIQVCPACSSVGVEVESKTIKYMLKADLREKQIKDKNWSVCINSDCNVAYFNDGMIFKTDDIKVSLWFKDSGLDVPICYCSALTRGEILNAVKNGCKTIDEVQKYTNKNITGKCREKNPLGKCCGNVFLKTIEEGRKNKV